MKPLNSTLINLSNLEYMGFIPRTYGAVRRKRIMELMEGESEVFILVNRMYSVQLKQDPDLRKLLKSGKLKRVRFGLPRSRQTYLVLNK